MQLIAIPVPARDERRRYLRYSVRCLCWLEGEQTTIFGPTGDVGLGGVFLRTAIPLEEGQRVEVALSIGEQADAVTAEGLVTRSVKVRQGLRHGVGVKFVRIFNGRDSLRRFLGKRIKPV